MFFSGHKTWMAVAAALLMAFTRTSAQSPAPETPGDVPPVVGSSASVSPAPSVSSVEPGRVLYPANGVQSPPAGVRGGGSPAGMPGLATSFFMLLALCAGGYYLLRRQTGFVPTGKGQRKLVVSESRSLGSRQFLVVVEYENERVLLGVTPGKIDYLCPLPMANVPAGGGFKEKLS